MADDTRAAATYAGYLKIDELLSLQQPRSAGPEHDETLFIIIHQVYELWFKELLHELDRVMQLLEADQSHGSQHTLKRIDDPGVMVLAARHLTMTPLSSSARERLTRPAASGPTFFRQVEFVLGVKSEQTLGRFADGSRARVALERRYHAATLWDAFLHYLSRERYAVPPAALARDVIAPVEPSPAIQEILVEVYRHDPKNAELCERLVDLDEGIQEWRYRHVKMVERIGTRRGTGGSAGAAYLRETVGHALFPDLWAIRSQF
jgi:tryptophan 2,3-dioxygenase